MDWILVFCVGFTYLDIIITSFFAFKLLVKEPHRL